MKWYLLPTPLQKQVGYTMHQFQNRGGMTIGPFAQLDFETASIVSQLESTVVFSNF